MSEEVQRIYNTAKFCLGIISAERCKAGYELVGISYETGKREWLAQTFDAVSEALTDDERIFFLQMINANNFKIAA